jgi:hypothetical protein
MNLSDYQKAFIDALSGKGKVPSWKVQSAQTVDVSTRFQIYRDSFLGNHFKALSNIYPSTERLVGKDYFNALGEDYLAQANSDMMMLDNIGKNFSTFLVAHPSKNDLPYLADFVALEWLWHEVLQGKSLAFSQHSCLFSSSYPLLELWKCAQEDYQGDFSVSFSQEMEYLLLFQQDHAVHLKKITREMFESFNARSIGSMP